MQRLDATSAAGAGAWRRPEPESIMSDEALRDRVRQALAFEPSIDDLHIDVTVENGVVMLNGYVETYAQKLAAEHTVQRVKGVRGIAQEIQVRTAAASSWPTTRSPRAEHHRVGFHCARWQGAGNGTEGLGDAERHGGLVLSARRRRARGAQAVGRDRHLEPDRSRAVGARQRHQAPDRGCLAAQRAAGGHARRGQRAGQQGHAQWLRE